MTVKNREYDKSLWGKGEWDNEPDRIDFIHAGFSCMMLRNMMGAWCGYVGVPSDHPAYGVNYSDYDTPIPNLNVHGGLTYASPCSGTICHTPQEGMPDDVWWLGFDTGHHMDVSPLDIGRMLRDTFDPGFTNGEYGTYKNVEYVTNEVKSLADQLKEMGTK